MDFKTLIFIAIIAYCESALPPTFEKCNRKQEDFSQCLQKAVQNAVKQLKVPFKQVGLPSLNPLVIPSMSIKAGSGPVGFDQHYKNMKLYGWPDCQCDTKMNFDNQTLVLDCLCPEIKGNFEYDFKGQLLVIPFSGKRLGTTSMIKVRYTLIYHFEEYTKNNNKHYKIKDSKFFIKPTKMIFHFDNLFEGSGNTGAAVSNNLNDVFNENWEPLFNDVKDQYEDVFNQVFGDMFDRFLSKVSVEELFGGK